MKMTAGFTATLRAAMAALLVPSAAFATDPHAFGAGAVSIGTAVSGTMALGANGSSSSYSHNAEAARATISTTRSYTPNHASVTAGAAGATLTKSEGVAFNKSTGAATGGAASAGFAETGTRGVVGIDGVTSGFNGGGSRTVSDNVIKAGRNQGSYVEGTTASGFEAAVGFGRNVSTAPAPAGSTGGTRTRSVEVWGSSSGYTNGATASGALQHMNAAGIANIGASGHYFGRTNAAGTTGFVPAP